MMNLYNYLAVMITERMTGLDHTCLKIWDVYAYMHALSTIKSCMNTVIISSILITVCIIAIIMLNKFEKKLKREEA